MEENVNDSDETSWNERSNESAARVDKAKTSKRTSRKAVETDVV